MRLVHVNVTQLRVAATCPRLHWFDTRATAERRDGRKVVSRIWRKGGETPGCGALFHTAVERFNAAAASSDEVLSALEAARDVAGLQQALMRWFNASCLDLDALAARPVPLRLGFISAVQVYMEELARLAVHARAAGLPAAELRGQLFGDSRKRVDVTFHVGEDVHVHVTGAIDYVYFDPRLGKHRIVDYKLTPATSPNSDLFQVFTYALMHHHQHGTRPDVAVFYLHPTRSVREARWEEVEAKRGKVHELIASMVAWSDHALGAGGLLPPGDRAYCDGCKHERSGACVAELGHKDRGAWDRRWTALEATPGGGGGAPEGRERVAAGAPAAEESTGGEPEADEPMVDEDPELEEALAVVKPAAERPRPAAGASLGQEAPRGGARAKPAEPAEAPPLEAPRGGGRAKPAEPAEAPPAEAPRGGARAKPAEAPPSGGRKAPPGGGRAKPAEAPPAGEPSTPAAGDAGARPPEARTANVTGMLLGFDDEGAPVCMDPAVLRTHVSVVGAAGSGKTWMAKVIAEEALRAGVPVLAIDPQGDLVQMMEARPRADMPAELHRAWEELRERMEPRILTPGSSHGLRLCLDPLRLPSASELSHIANPALRAEEEEGLLVAVAANLVSLCACGGEEESQRTFLYQVLRQLPRAAPVRLRDIVAAVTAPEDLGIDEVDTLIRKSERERLARRLNTFVQGPSARLFTGGTRLDFTELLRPSKPGRVPLNIVYLNALSNDDEKHFFLAALATELYRWMITTVDASTGGGVNLLFYIDEARDWIPAGGSKPPAKQPLIRLFTQGRKYGVGCLLCTQSPRSVDYNVFGNTSTKLIGRLEAAQDVDRVIDWFTNEGGAPSWVAARKGAPKGSFVARWPDMPAELSGRAFKGRTLFTRHAGAWSPDRVERAVTEAGLRGAGGVTGGAGAGG
ncbi:helicase HerA-like domain-containing protein [Sorangium sp. So ce388]|uniref:helicase HerA-like domain-containing protein n=1 Tax=Sorangium sp. So ce388 TaxID=3133309 RepID=UPI003F5BEF4D